MVGAPFWCLNCRSGIVKIEVDRHKVAAFGNGCVLQLESRFDFAIVAIVIFVFYNDWDSFCQVGSLETIDHSGRLVVADFDEECRRDDGCYRICVGSVNLRVVDAG